MFGIILLAAGASSRMGRPKMLLPFGNTSVLGHLIAQWQELGSQQEAVVIAAGDKTLEEELERCRFPEKNRIRNPVPEKGMFSSVQCAARWTGWDSGLNHFVIALGDQPHLKPATLRALLKLSENHPQKICQLSRQGRPRHPVLLPKAAFQALANSQHANLKEFLKSLSIGLALTESDDAGLDLDIDHPADYEAALRMAFGAEGGT